MGGLITGSLTYFLLLQSAPLWLRVAWLVAAILIGAVVFAIVLCAVGYRLRPFVRVYEVDDRTGICLWTSVVTGGKAAVVAFSIETQGQPTIHSARHYIAPDGREMLLGADSATSVQPHRNWLETPVEFEAAGARVGWVGFGMVHIEGYTLQGKHPTLVALMDDQRTIRARIPGYE